MTREVNVLVIGGGPGGYPAAIRSAQLGKNVLLVEKQAIGGECLNWGCIPSKAMIEGANLFHKISNDAPELGIETEGLRIDAMKLQKWKNGVAERLVRGVKMLLKNNGVETLMGTARFTKPHHVEVSLDSGEKEQVRADDIIIAIGSEFNSVPSIEMSKGNILSPKDALELEEIPEELVFIGGGLVAMELGTAFSKLGSKVHIVEQESEVLPDIEPSLVRVVKRRMRKLGVEFHVNSTLDTVREDGNGSIEIKIAQEDKEPIKISANKLVISAGKRARDDELGLKKIGIRTGNQGFIEVDGTQKTNVDHHYAIGDCTGPPFLAHKATKNGIIAAEVIAGKHSKADFRAMPGVIFTDPEIAYAGMKEREAETAGYQVMTARAPFSASGRALTTRETGGFVKAVVETGTGVILGVQIVGSHASDLISEVALALEMGALAEDLAFTVHPHPTLPEMIMEAMGAIQGMAINVINPKK